MNAKEFIEKHLQNCQYGFLLTAEAASEAQEQGLVIVFGESDDLCIFRGAIQADAYCDNGDDIYVSADKVIANKERPNVFIPEDNPNYALISAQWCKGDYSWSYETEIPHETFEVYDDDEKYCLGIVFSINDIRPKLTNYERIKNMNLEEMAKFLEDVSKNCLHSECHNCPIGIGTDGICYNQGIESWLEKATD